MARVYARFSEEQSAGPRLALARAMFHAGVPRGMRVDGSPVGVLTQLSASADYLLARAVESETKAKRIARKMRAVRAVVQGSPTEYCDPAVFGRLETDITMSHRMRPVPAPPAHLLAERLRREREREKAE